jgi:hypothetical protein
MTFSPDECAFDVEQDGLALCDVEALSVLQEVMDIATRMKDTHPYLCSLAKLYVTRITIEDHCVRFGEVERASLVTDVDELTLRGDNDELMADLSIAWKQKTQSLPESELEEEIDEELKLMLQIAMSETFANGNGDAVEGDEAVEDANDDASNDMETEDEDDEELKLVLAIAMTDLGSKNEGPVDTSDDV